MDILITLQASTTSDTDLIGIKETMAYALEGKDIIVKHIDISEVDI